MRCAAAQPIPAVPASTGEGVLREAISVVEWVPAQAEWWKAVAAND
jgi:hypothetical protein